jgi:uncharacterized protein (TIGR02757 family)
MSSHQARTLILEAYRRYHAARFIHPDPLEIVLEYEEPADREVAALICASLALGRVASVLSACRQALGRLGGSGEAMQPHSGAPARAPQTGRLSNVVAEASLGELRERFDGFVYRFFGREEMAHFLFAVGEVIRRRGSLEAGFLEHVSPREETVLGALGGFSRELSAYAGGIHGLLLAQVDRGSAAKRWHLFLRWLVRHDCIDPGGWHRVSPSRLVVPMDTHMHRICRRLGILSRKSADGRAAIEATRFFRSMAPADPARFDFSLTRLGINPEAGRESETLLERWAPVGAEPGLAPAD